MIRLKILTVRKIINFVRCIGHKTYYANISPNTELFTFLNHRSVSSKIRELLKIPVRVPSKGLKKSVY